jgi:hypothetical protein
MLGVRRFNHSTFMKSSIVLVLLACMTILVSQICHAQSHTERAKREPNGGYVSDASAAQDIAKTVLSHLLTPDWSKFTAASEATLTNGVWTVHCWGPKTRINFAITIQIRQKTGWIITYQNPNA